MRAILKESTANYIIGKFNTCRFRKKIMNCQFLIPQKKLAKMAAKMTTHHLIKPQICVKFGLNIP